MNKIDNTPFLPNRVDIIRSSILAVIIALILLLLFILPAEYNIDITGLGEKMGLTALAQPLASVNETIELNQDTVASQDTVARQDTVASQNTVTVIVPALSGIEYKFYLAKHQKMTYQWHTDGADLYVDLHGEPAADTTGYYESYTIATVKQINGQFTTPFAGVHGWYWKNNTNKNITVTLTTQGNYRVLGIKK
jgi:hypothetical protein